MNANQQAYYNTKSRKVKGEMPRLRDFFAFFFHYFRENRIWLAVFRFENQVKKVGIHCRTI